MNWNVINIRFKVSLVTVIIVSALQITAQVNIDKKSVVFKGYTKAFTSLGAYTNAAKPLSRVAYHKFCVNFGQPWCMFEVQQG